MRIAVIQHRIREDAVADVSALIEAAHAAADRGAEFVVMPEVPSLRFRESVRESLYAAFDGIAGKRLVPFGGPGHPGIAHVADSIRGAEGLGRLALFVGDAAFRGTEWLNALASRPDFVVLCPRSESDLQAEAAFEVALALSDAMAGLVLVSECAGAEPGQPGHGGSAIILLGEVVAEALDEDDILIADIDVPAPHPEPREPLPALPTILSQRLAYHAGQRPEVEYPADLSEGSGPA